MKSIKQDKKQKKKFLRNKIFTPIITAAMIPSVYFGATNTNLDLNLNLEQNMQNITSKQIQENQKEQEFLGSEYNSFSYNALDYNELKNNLNQEVTPSLVDIILSTNNEAAVKTKNFLNELNHVTETTVNQYKNTTFKSNNTQYDVLVQGLDKIEEILEKTDYHLTTTNHLTQLAEYAFDNTKNREIKEKIADESYIHYNHLDKGNEYITESKEDVNYLYKDYLSTRNQINKTIEQNNKKINQLTKEKQSLESKLDDAEKAYNQEINKAILSLQKGLPSEFYQDYVKEVSNTAYEKHVKPIEDSIKTIDSQIESVKNLNDLYLDLDNRFVKIINDIESVEETYNDTILRLSNLKRIDKGILNAVLVMQAQDEMKEMKPNVSIELSPTLKYNSKDGNLEGFPNGSVRAAVRYPMGNEDLSFSVGGGVTASNLKTKDEYNRQLEINEQGLSMYGELAKQLNENAVLLVGGNYDLMNRNENLSIDDLVIVNNEENSNAAKLKSGIYFTIDEKAGLIGYLGGSYTNGKHGEIKSNGFTIDTELLKLNGLSDRQGKIKSTSFNLSLGKENYKQQDLGIEQDVYILDLGTLVKWANDFYLKTGTKLSLGDDDNKTYRLNLSLGNKVLELGVTYEKNSDYSDKINLDLKGVYTF